MHRFRRREFAECGYCGGVDTVGHVIFDCPRGQKYRVELEIKIDRTITSENVIDIMLEGETIWGGHQRTDGDHKS